MCSRSSSGTSLGGGRDLVGGDQELRRVPVVEDAASTRAPRPRRDARSAAASPRRRAGPLGRRRAGRARRLDRSPPSGACGRSRGGHLRRRTRAGRPRRSAGARASLRAPRPGPPAPPRRGCAGARAGRARRAAPAWRAAGGRSYSARWIGSVDASERAVARRVDQRTVERDVGLVVEVLGSRAVGGALGGGGHARSNASDSAVRCGRRCPLRRQAGGCDLEDPPSTPGTRRGSRLHGRSRAARRGRPGRARSSAARA